ncbi:putative ABC transporter permease [Butyrivibrio sp. AC2005]|uniref:putative ABC transporter permease n=1 Tax=Butyrivibrio sp. AC2005 TaxID=1280672 RepID=UPI0004027B62|nr:putative ABC transporter permease [Butyrivibrio sp. AC2005]
MFVSKFFIEFMVYSFIGWIYECTYCTVKEGHWRNRGFLFGPICPIYGTGAVACSIVFGYLPMFRGIPYNMIPIWKIFIICALGSIVLEYSTSYILEKKFHAVWWEYYDMPLNINGRVCVPATLGFGFAGILVTRFACPVAENIRNMMNPLLAEIIALLLMAYLAADLVLTVSSLVHLQEMVAGAMAEFDERMEDFYITAASTPGKAKEAITSVPVKAREAVAFAAERLDFRQKYQLGNIKNFRFKRPVFRGGKKLNTDRMSEFYRGLQDRIRTGNDK